jgi:hypothetical protein
MSLLLKQPCFPTGIVTVTAKAQEALQRSGKTALEFVLRHSRGDFGDVDICDIMVNTVAVRTKGAVLSSYRLPIGGRLWVETNPERTKTTVSLRGEEEKETTP